MLWLLIIFTLTYVPWKINKQKLLKKLIFCHGSTTLLSERPKTKVDRIEILYFQIVHILSSSYKTAIRRETCMGLANTILLSGSQRFNMKQIIQETQYNQYRYTTHTSSWVAYRVLYNMKNMYIKYKAPPIPNVRFHEWVGKALYWNPYQCSGSRGP